MMADINMNDHKDMTALEPRWPEDGLESVQACPVCGETRREVLYEGLTDRVFFCAPSEWTLYRCLGCRSGYLDPRPSSDTIALAYRRYFTHELSDEEAVDSEPKRGFSGFKTRLRNGYLNNLYNLTLKPASPLWRLAVPWFSIRRNGILRLHDIAAPHPGARLLDIGCGNGALLRQATSIGWEAQGLELDPLAATAARSAGFHVQEGHLPDTGFPSDYFDGVTLSHVIEHLHDPLRSLQEICRILAPGGKLWIATPNLESPLHRRFGRNWLALDPPRHLVLFNLTSLVSACRRNGFHPVTVCKSPHSVAWMTASSRSIGLGEDPMSTKLAKLDLADRFQTLILDWAATLCQEWGEELVVIATKPFNNE